MSKLLFIEEFQQVRFADYSYFTLAFPDPKDAGNHFEITLEPCTRGYCVGIYDKNKIVLVKKCTNLDRRVDILPINTLTVGIKLANALYEEFLTKGCR